MVKIMKNLLKAEFYLLLKQKFKLTIIPVLMIVYLAGTIFANGSHQKHLNDMKKGSVKMIQRVSRENLADRCVLGINIDLMSDKLCGKEYFSEEEISFATSRLPYNEDFFFKLLSLNAKLHNEKYDEYHLAKLEMLNSAKIMQQAGFENVYYLNQEFDVNNAQLIVDREIEMVKQIVDNNYKIQMTPYQVSAANYMRVFLSNGGLVAFILIIILFNIDVFISEDSRHVNNVLYSQTYSRLQINMAKIIVSIIYSLTTVMISLGLSSIIIGFVFGFGSLGYPVLMRNNINSFKTQSFSTFKISNILKQLYYISLITGVLTIASLSVLHLITMLLQNPSAGLFLVFFLLGARFILKETLNHLFTFFPFAYDNFKAIFNENYNYLYAVLSLVTIALGSIIMTLKIGNKIDIKAGD